MEPKSRLLVSFSISTLKHFTEVHGAEAMEDMVLSTSLPKHFTEVHGAEEVVYSGLFTGS